MTLGSRLVMVDLRWLETAFSVDLQSCYAQSERYDLTSISQVPAEC
jgi:hypothetical protein